MSRAVLRLRTDVDQHDISRGKAIEQLLLPDGLEGIGTGERLLDGSVDISEALASEITKRKPEPEDGVIGEPVEDARGIPPRKDEASLGEQPQLARGIGDGQAGGPRQLLDGLLTLGQPIDEPQTGASAKGSGDRSKLLKTLLLAPSSKYARPIGRTQGLSG